MGDKLESLTQAFNLPISDFDLKTILLQIYPELTTRKVLLVGHSQGSFYVNELYDYLTAHGVPKESIGTYEIATPASYVAGAGSYVTSTNDKVINSVRTGEIDGNIDIYVNSYYTTGNIVNSALRANITVPPEAGYADDEYGGHAFSVYLDGAGDKIVNDIQTALSRLKASGDTSGACFEPPAEDVSYKMNALRFAFADPLAKGVSDVVRPSARGQKEISRFIASAVQGGTRYALSLLSSSPKDQAAAVVLAEPAITTALASPKQTATRPAATPQPKSAPQEISALQPTSAPTRNAAPSVPTMPTTFVPPSVPPASSFLPLYPIAPGFGGGGGGSASNTASPSARSSSGAITVALAVTSPVGTSYSATSSLIVTGTATPNTSITATIGSSAATTTADANGNWTMDLALAEGDDPLSFQAADTDGDLSATVTVHVIVDTIAPNAPGVSSVDCDASIVSGFCVIPASSATLTWPQDHDAMYFEIVKDGSTIATTTATSSVVSLSSDATSTFKVVAYDLAGNAATSTAFDIATLSRSLIINEVAWGGDDTSHSDQWIELENTSPYTIDLGHVTLTRTAGDPIALSGTVPAHNLIVVEASNIPFTGSNKDIVAFTPLSTTTAEQLALEWKGTTLDSTPGVGACASWCAGAYDETVGTTVTFSSSTKSPLSMERTSDTVPGSLHTNWHTTDSYGPWIGVTNSAYWGTPGIANSSGLPEAGVTCTGTGFAPDNGRAYNPGTTDCLYLSRFITGGAGGANRYVGLYRGTQGSSTPVTGHSIGVAIARDTADTVPSDAVAGEPYYFAIWEARNWPTVDDVTSFSIFFKTGGPAPHGNYALFPFTYQP